MYGTSFLHDEIMSPPLDVSVVSTATDTLELGLFLFVQQRSNVFL